MKYVLRTKQDNGKYKYILDKNFITVKTFDCQTSALNFLKDRIEDIKYYFGDVELSKWECITLRHFRSELERTGPLVW